MPFYPSDAARYATERDLNGCYLVYRKWVIPASCTEILQLPHGMYLPPGVTKVHYFTEIPNAVCAKFFRHGRSLRGEVYARMDTAERIDYHAFMEKCNKAAKNETKE